uniref:Uncharacterized protein n=1 Tax=Romanomermis culicivorax TaxID=13658 RepID=A0A915IZV2_ROMCU
MKKPVEKAAENCRHKCARLIFRKIRSKKRKANKNKQVPAKNCSDERKKKVNEVPNTHKAGWLDKSEEDGQLFYKSYTLILTGVDFQEVGGEQNGRVMSKKWQLTRNRKYE